MGRGTERLIDYRGQSAERSLNVDNDNTAWLDDIICNDPPGSEFILIRHRRMCRTRGR